MKKLLDWPILQIQDERDAFGLLATARLQLPSSVHTTGMQGLMGDVVRQVPEAHPCTRLWEPHFGPLCFQKLLEQISVLPRCSIFTKDEGKLAKSHRKGRGDCAKQGWWTQSQVGQRCCWSPPPTQKAMLTILPLLS